MAKPAPRELIVSRKEKITPNMLRITLGGKGMDNFPADQESAYVKLMLPAGEGERPMVRTYTIRAQRADEIDIDFALHEHMGPATQWAVDAKTGDAITLGGPGPQKLINPEADWFLIAGDMTALPAISVNLERLPSNAKGNAVIEVIEKGDIQDLATPEGFHIEWLINPEPGQNSGLLSDHVKNLPWPEGQPSVWAACELSSMQNLRIYFRGEKKLDKHSLYLSSYWKYGGSEDKHRVAKRLDAQLNAE